MGLRDFLIKLLNKKTLQYVGRVELSIGVIYLKPLTYGMVNKCKQKSCIGGNIMNDPLFFELMDYELTNLSKKQIQQLSVADGNKLRDAIRDLLIKEGVVKIEGTAHPENFNAEDIRKLDEMKEEAQRVINLVNAENRKVNRNG